MRQVPRSTITSTAAQLQPGYQEWVPRQRRINDAKLVPHQHHYNRTTQVIPVALLPRKVA